MRRILSLAALGVLLASTSAQAASAPFTAALSLTVATNPPVTFVGSGTGETEGSGPASIPANVITAGFVSRLTTPIFGLITGFSVCAPGLGSAVFPIPALPGPENAVLDCNPLANGNLLAVSYNGAGAGTGGLDAGAYLNGANGVPLVSIPLNVIGVGGTSNFLVLGSPSTLVGNPWTTGTVSASGTVPEAHTISDTGFDNRDPVTGLGTVKLVTSALATLGALGTAGSVAALTITYQPQPSAPGDINGDGRIDAEDFQLIRGSLGKCTGTDGFLAAADFDESGCVDYRDYRIWYGLYRGNLNSLRLR